MNSGITFSDATVQRCPVDAYKVLRTSKPVYLDPVSGTYVLTRYEDIKRVLLDPTRFSNRTGLGVVRDTSQKALIDAIYEKVGGSPVPALLDLDPPAHQSHRALVDRVFLPSRVAMLEPRINSIVSGLVEEMAIGEEVDFVAQFADKLPMQVITGVLGLPSEDASRFRFWSALSLENQDVTLSPEREIYVATQLVEMRQYFMEAIARARAAPTDGLLTDLVKIEGEEQSVMNLAELVSILHQLLVAGNETTAMSLTNALKILIDEPEVASRLRENAADIPKFVEESLRLMTPVQTLFRKATVDVVIGGVSIPAGAIVEVRYGAANSDPEMYSCPEKFDLDRRNVRTHLAFSAGIHSCIGSRLARSEMCLAIGKLLARFKNISYARGDKSEEYSHRYVSYSMSRLWVRFS